MKECLSQRIQLAFTKLKFSFVVGLIGCFLWVIPVAAAAPTKNTFTVNLEHISLFLSIAANILGLIIFYNAAANKRYAAQRDFQELVLGQQKIIGELQTLNKLMDEHEDNTYKRVNDSMVTVVRAIDEFKMLLNALMVKVEGQPISGILGKRKSDE